jgi:uracil-DNA glycosylase
LETTDVADTDAVADTADTDTGEAHDLDQLRARASELFSAASAGISDRPVVFGDGNSHADLMIVGEAPGEQEERRGRPFIGPAGRLLDGALAALGIQRHNLWITNLVKQRPVNAAGGRLKNRPPRADEVRAWAPILAREIELIRPAVVLCLGAPAASSLIHRGFRLGAERGQWFDGPAGTRVSATYHPAYILRLVGESRDLAQRAFRDDIAAAWSEARKLRAS